VAPPPATSVPTWPPPGGLPVTPSPPLAPNLGPLPSKHRPGSGRLARWRRSLAGLLLVAAAAAAGWYFVVGPGHHHQTAAVEVTTALVHD